MAAEHPLELLGRHDRHHPVSAVALSRFHVGTDVVELAVVQAGAVRLLQGQDRDAVARRVVLDLTTEPVSDLLEQRRRRDRVAQVIGQEPDHLAAHLQVGHVGVEVQPVDALDLQRDMAVQHVVDVHHRRRYHPRGSTPARSHAPQIGGQRAGFAGPDQDRLPQGRPGGGRGEGLPSPR